MASDASIPLTTPDPEKLSKAFNQFFDIYRDYVETIATRIDKQFDLNKQASSFFERIMYIDLGTVSLSLTAITSIAPKLALPPQVKHQLLVWLIVSWICFLLSATLCRQMMQITITANKMLFQEWAKMSEKYNLQMVSRVTQQMAVLMVGGKIRVGDIEAEPGALIGELSKNMREVVNEMSKSPVPELLKRETTESGKNVSRFSILFMQIGLIVLCYVAVRFLLWL